MNFVVKDFKFASGQTLPELKMHYRTLGQPVLGKEGKVANAVLIPYGTGGAGGNFVEGAGGKLFAGELFGTGRWTTSKPPSRRRNMRESRCSSFTVCQTRLTTG